MSDSSRFGWMLLIVVPGLILAGMGLVWILAPAIPWMGRLSGDMPMEREHLGLSLPLGTCLLLSLLLARAVWVVRLFRD